jgi:hypothetical protein
MTRATTGRATCAPCASAATCSTTARSTGGGAAPRSSCAGRSATCSRGLTSGRTPAYGGAKWAGVPPRSNSGAHPTAAGGRFSAHRSSARCSLVPPAGRHRPSHEPGRPTKLQTSGCTTRAVAAPANFAVPVFFARYDGMPYRWVLSQFGLARGRIPWVPNPKLGHCPPLMSDRDTQGDRLSHAVSIHRRCG